MGLPPLSLYIHFPWCVKKCPYCDFNSHTLKDNLPESEYIQHLLQDLDTFIHDVADREIISIFMGGGTPSLFSPQSIAHLLRQLKTRLRFQQDIEITLEANPGTVEQNKFNGFFDAGINRISVGVQSFQDPALKHLGRIHQAKEALSAITALRKAGFNNFNIDLMYGLPQQTPQEAMADLETALSFSPPHLSWYQLTLEPNTFFYKHPPPLPSEKYMGEIEAEGLSKLERAGLKRYEISAYTQQKPCRHNLNYWEFGDYLGIGAGAHGKITCLETQTIHRYHNTKSPKQYMSPEHSYQKAKYAIPRNEIAFEYMLNALRLTNGTPIQHFNQRTFIPLDEIAPMRHSAYTQKLLDPNPDLLRATPLGLNFLNDLTLLFLPNTTKAVE